MKLLTSRRSLFGAAAALLPALAGRAASSTAISPLRLITRPRRVFKATDLPKERSEAWFVLLIAEARAPTHPLPSRMTISYRNGAEEVARSEYRGAALAAMAIQGLSAPADTNWPFAIRIVARQPIAARIDRMHVALIFERAPTVEGIIAVETYTQKTPLIFPFRGNGIVTQAGAANGGHRNGSGQFAIDAMGLSHTYAVQNGSAFFVNADLVGFGRDLIAPGSGTVVVALGDRPDQPVPGESNEAFHRPDLRGAGDPGNHVVIDHGNGEFSMIAHLKAHSLAVRAGERVIQGQRIGALGNSGDSSAPHVHHQLQDGPDWRTDSALPHHYTNIDSQSLERGTFFTAR